LANVCTNRSTPQVTYVLGPLFEFMAITLPAGPITNLKLAALLLVGAVQQYRRRHLRQHNTAPLAEANIVAGSDYNARDLTARTRRTIRTWRHVG
jgi:hypothetical protein